MPTSAGSRCAAPAGPMPPTRSVASRVQKVAAEIGCTANQLVVAWLMRQPRTSPIIGVRTWEQYAENVAAADVVIPDELLAVLDGV